MEGNKVSNWVRVRVEFDDVAYFANPEQAKRWVTENVELGKDWHIVPCVQIPADVVGVPLPPGAINKLVEQAIHWERNPPINPETEHGSYSKGYNACSRAMAYAILKTLGLAVPTYSVTGWSKDP